MQGACRRPFPWYDEKPGSRDCLDSYRSRVRRSGSYLFRFNRAEYRFPESVSGLPGNFFDRLALGKVHWTNNLVRNAQRDTACGWRMGSDRRRCRPAPFVAVFRLTCSMSAMGFVSSYGSQVRSTCHEQQQTRRIILLNGCTPRTRLFR